MQREELIALARAAGFVTGKMGGQIDLVVTAGKGCVVELERFAQLLTERLTGGTCGLCGGTGTLVVATVGELPAKVHAKCPGCAG